MQEQISPEVRFFTRYGQTLIASRSVAFKLSNNEMKPRGAISNQFAG